MFPSSPCQSFGTAKGTIGRTHKLSIEWGGGPFISYILNKRLKIQNLQRIAEIK